MADSSSSGKLLDFAQKTLGNILVYEDVSWPHGESIVLHVTGSLGEGFVKSHRSKNKWAIERKMYLELVPMLGDRAPELLDQDEETHSLLLSRLRGSQATDIDEESIASLHRLAGELLRTFHELTPPRPITDWKDQLQERLGKWIASATPEALRPDEIAFAESEISAAPSLVPEGVIAHWDWQPRNWFLDGNVLRVFDFEHARPDSWMADLQKLWWGHWVDRPDLREAFLRGYGTGHADLDPALFRPIAAFHLITTIVWADNHRDSPYRELGRQGLERLSSSRKTIST